MFRLSIATQYILNIFCQNSLVEWNEMVQNIQKLRRDSNPIYRKKELGRSQIFFMIYLILTYILFVWTNFQHSKIRFICIFMDLCGLWTCVDLGNMSRVTLYCLWPVWILWHENKGCIYSIYCLNYHYLPGKESSWFSTIYL